MVNMAKGDLANGRLPWVSIKTPVWADMAAGKHDAEIDEMLRALDALSGPVWLTIWHEPENDLTTGQTPQTHRDMNKRVRQRMTALGTDNIALVQTMMYWTYDSRSGRDPDAYWGAGIYDIAANDIYREEETSLIIPSWLAFRSWAKSKGVDVAVGEWGIRGTSSRAGDLVREWYNHAIGSATDGKGARVVGLAAFDSGLNATNGSWELRGEQLRVFQELLNDPRTANPN